MAHYDPLRPNRYFGNPDPYEFAHGKNSLLVYRSDTLDFVKEIPVGKGPDCHALTCSGKILYLATLDGTYLIDTETLEVAAVIDTGAVYATNALPDGDTMFIHDNFGGLFVIKNAEDPARAYIYKHLQLIGDGRCDKEEMLGGKGQFLPDGRYLCAGWRSGKLFTIDPARDYAFEEFMPFAEETERGDDLVMTADRKTAYVACHRDYYPAHVTVIDVENRRIRTVIPTGNGTCGLTMTADERYVIASNDKDASVSIIDTQTDKVVRVLCAREGFIALHLPENRIQGISAGEDDCIYVYECSGYGALVRFSDILGKGTWEVSHRGQTFKRERFQVSL